MDRETNTSMYGSACYGSNIETYRLCFNLSIDVLVWTDSPLTCALNYIQAELTMEWFNPDAAGRNKILSVIFKVQTTSMVEAKTLENSALTWVTNGTLLQVWDSNSECDWEREPMKKAVGGAGVGVGLGFTLEGSLYLSLMKKTRNSVSLWLWTSDYCIIIALKSCLGWIVIVWICVMFDFDLQWCDCIVVPDRCYREKGSALIRCLYGSLQLHMIQGIWCEQVA